MTDLTQLLQGYSLNALKAIAATHNASTALSKSQIVEGLVKRLSDPKAVELLLIGLSPAQQTALYRAKQYGGHDLRLDLLRAQLGADGITDIDKVIASLVRLGLLIQEKPGVGTGMLELWTKDEHGYYYRPPVFRMAPAAMEQLEIPPDLGHLPVEPFTEPVDRVLDSPFSTLQRDLYQFVRYLRENKVKLLKSGLVSKRDFTRINQLMAEPEDLKEVYSFEETFRLRFLHLMLSHAGLIAVTDGELRATAKAESFFLQPELEQARALLQTWRKMQDWNEFFHIPWLVPVGYEMSSSTDVPGPGRLPHARQDVLDLLNRERPHGQWFSLPSFIASMQRYKLGFLIPHRGDASPYSYYYGSREKKEDPLYYGFRPRGDKSYNERFSKTQHWAMVEGGFIAAVLQWALRWLGIVRTGAKGESIAAFQVTEFGAAVLGWTDASTWAPAAPARALIVQPNFEIVAMLESAGFGLLAELDRFAERVKLDKAALYRLTRESVCRGLQSGLTRGQIEETLRARSGMPLPQNVEFTLREWEELFNRIHIQKRTILVEAGTEAELDERLEDLQLTGARRLSPTAALIDAEAARKLLAWGRGPKRRVLIHDHAQTTADTFRFADAREIEICPGLGSPLLEHRLARLAVPMKNGRFLLEPDRVRSAVSSLTLEAVVRFLEEGTGKPLSPDTRLTLEGWAGKFPRLQLGKMMALTTPRAEALETILHVPELAQHVRRLAPTVALIPEKEAPGLRKALEARGVTLAEGADLDLALALARDAESEEVSLLFVKPKRRREIIDEAIARRRKLLVGYQNWNATRMVIHEVDPMKVLDTGGAGALVGYSYRERYQMQFAIQQIQGIRMLDKPIDGKVTK